MEEADFNKLCRLSRLSVTDQEKPSFLTSLDSILEYVALLNNIDTEGVLPCFTIHETLHSVLREDVPEPPLSREAALANAPAHTGGMFRVPPVLKQA